MLNENIKGMSHEGRDRLQSRPRGSSLLAWEGAALYGSHFCYAACRGAFWAQLYLCVFCAGEAPKGLPARVARSLAGGARRANAQSDGPAQGARSLTGGARRAR